MLSTSRGLPAPAPSLRRLVSRGTIDAELAALVWWLLDAEVPLVVAGPDGPQVGLEVLDRLLDSLPPEAPLLRFEGGDLDGFAWLPQAAELGWPRPSGPLPPAGRRPAWPGTRLIVPRLADAPGAVWGVEARVLIRSLQLGYSLATTVEADSLRDLLARLGTSPVALADDELRRLGLVLIVVEGKPPLMARVEAAHFLRPLERDAQGHLQRQPPAVLASWDDSVSRFEHFAWGLVPELEVRFGRGPRELERELAERQRLLSDGGPAG